MIKKTETAQFWTQLAHQHLTLENLGTLYNPAHLLEGNVRWFDGAELNASIQCIDRHLPHHADKTALIYEKDTPGETEYLTFQALHDAVCQFANLLKHHGAQKGDRICIYMPMCADGVIAMLACARIGAIHSVVFGGFSPEALVTRIEDAACKLVLTVKEGNYGGKHIPYRQRVEEALTHHALQCTIIDDWQSEVNTLALPSTCTPTPMAAEDPLFILYTSGSTGRPKGVVHTHAGYLLYAAHTHKTVFDIQPEDIYWCTANIGWITGHTYVVYGPLMNATTTLIFEGTMTHPTQTRFYDIIETHAVSIFYTAPTAIRMLMKFGEEILQKASLKSLRILGSVGEPINPEAWHWYHDKMGEGRCKIMDTWWQTETGGIMLAPLVPADQQKAGSAMRPLPHIHATISEDDTLLISAPWPSMARTIYGDHARYLDTYLKPFPDHYCTHDGAHYDEDGDIWISGRTDDVLSIAGHRLGTAEIEAAFSTHPLVNEAAVIGVPDAITGEKICAFLCLTTHLEEAETHTESLITHLHAQIGKIAHVNRIIFTPDLPKTRSGKIMRRLLRKIVAGEIDQMGDLSTLANPEIIDILIGKV